MNYTTETYHECSVCGQFMDDGGTNEQEFICNSCTKK